jgi:hypothetical protein
MENLSTSAQKNSQEDVFLYRNSNPLLLSESCPHPETKYSDEHGTVPKQQEMGGPSELSEIR